MPSKNRPLSPEELAAYEASRDFTSDLIQSIREMKAGLGTVVYSPVIEACKKTGLSQLEFATLLDVPVSALQDWEKGSARPNETTLKLVSLAITNPQAFLDLVRSKPK